VLVRAALLTVADVQVRWFSETPDVPGSKSWGTSFPRCALIVGLQVRGEEEHAETLRVINVHLDHASRRAREKSCELLAGWVRESSAMPTIVLGDLNTGVDAAALSPLWAAGLVDAHAALPAKGPGAATFHGYRGSTNGRRIDAILVSQELVVEEAAIRHDLDAARRASDHWPVSATLRRTE
jgi:endonuclease/exonuclease/phosphatase family metal-dependent hydrolase